MQQLTYVKKNTLQWRDVKEPELQSPTDAIVRPIAAARCDGDKVFLFNNITKPMKAGLMLHYLDPVTADLLGNNPFQPPLAVGHEGVAEVVSCGEDVKDFRRGDKVIVPWAVSCGSCFHCKSGLTSKCSDAGETLLSAYGFGSAMGPWGSMVSDLVRVPFADHMLVPVPQGLDPVALASASDNIPDGWRTVAPYLRKRPGAPVLIAGGAAESIGLYAAAIAIAVGASKVDYVDYLLPRLDIAESLGANPIQMPKKQRTAWYRKHAPRRNGEYPVTVDASANPDGLRYTIRSLAPGGTCTSVGYYFQTGVSLPLMQMYVNGSTLHTGISHARADLPDLLELIKTESFQPAKITTVLSDWEDAPEAFLERTTKAKIKPNGMIWISWPKKASKVTTDVSEDVIREICLPMGLVDVKVCAINDTWSGLKLMIRKEQRAKTP